MLILNRSISYEGEDICIKQKYDINTFKFSLYTTSCTSLKHLITQKCNNNVIATCPHVL